MITYPSILHERIRIVLLLHQILEHIVVTLGSRKPYRRATEVRLALGRGAALHQQLHDVQVSGARCAVQRRPAILVRGVDLRTLAQQHLDHLIMAVGRRNMEARLAVSVRAVQKLRRSAQQQADHRYVTTETGQV